jgi:hypothetical protein
MNGLDPSAVTGVDIRVNPCWLTVCDIKQPRTGLEAKFSYIMVTAMTLHGGHRFRQNPCHNIEQ